MGRIWPTVTSKIVLAMLIGVLLSTPVEPHGGGLDSQGCHTNRRTGDYHCHRGSSASPPPPWRPPSRGRTSATKPQRLLAPSSDSAATRRPEVRIPESDLVASIQLLLTALNYEPGPASGRMGAETEGAIMRFQADHAQQIDGRPSGALLVLLSRAVRLRLRPGTRSLR